MSNRRKRIEDVRREAAELFDRRMLTMLRRGRPALDRNGIPVLNENGKQVYTAPTATDLHAFRGRLKDLGIVPERTDPVEIEKKLAALPAANIPDPEPDDTYDEQA